MHRLWPHVLLVPLLVLLLLLSLLSLLLYLLFARGSKAVSTPPFPSAETTPFARRFSGRKPLKPRRAPVKPRPVVRPPPLRSPKCLRGS